ncbi:hypothetical protein J5N97_005308 [Dioscorea zingiberensis]|uniref:Disease resistance protein RPM1-like n=1 Tax=Dioscorea zingiberensis TaxID=325984 RepID=A0A9D5DAH4_9LILI|nr:hypothetical protein J5N97_005308 [Dioscorea zingiberensis]
MANIFMQFILEKLEYLLVSEEQLLSGVSTGVEDIQAELDSIRLILRKSDICQENDSMRTWISQLREISYDIEDVLEDFMLHFGTHHGHGHGFIGFLHKKFHYVTHLGARHRIANAIQEIKTNVGNISTRRNMYDINLTDGGPSTSTARDRLHDRHVAALFIEEAELVGIDKPREELIKWVVKGGLQLRVISVVGMGGLGKTTLVRKVYDNERVKGWFSCHAWITVTQSFTIDGLLRSIVIQFFNEGNKLLPRGLEAMEGIQLMEVLRDFLIDKRYVIVFDDVWQIHAWDILKYALPDNTCGSRILITTRIGDVGTSCLESSGHVYNLQPLPPMKAWFLFCKKAFQSTEGVCPPELEDLSQNIVKICAGLPLAIVAIGGLLSKKETSVEWKKLCDNLHSELANNPKLEPVKRILTMSYSDLPHFLKSCFLYFSILPKDYPIKSNILIRLWIAEGFIEREKGETMEAVAQDYLHDLIDRSMVQVAEYYDYGRVRSVKVHDLIREIIFLKSNEENFSTSQFKQSTKVHGRIRRLSIHDDCEYLLENISLSQVRAFFLFRPNNLSMTCMKNLFSGFRLLKVLDLEGASMGRFPIAFDLLLHLRYLSLRNTKINKISKSLEKLKNLETLDLKGTRISKLPRKIVRLQKLRHILAYQYYTSSKPPFYHTYGVTVPQGIGNLKELQKLSYMEASQSKHILRELGNLTQLKRLGIVNLKTEDGAELCASLAKLSHLQSLSVASMSMDELLDIQSLSSPPPTLQRLYLRGPLQTLPHWIGALKNLVRMRLRWSRLQEDSVMVLQALPNLVELTLICSYDGTILCSQKGGFQKLKIFDLEQLDNLKQVMVEGAMPNLRKMYIRSCMKLEMVPLGIEGLANLSELHLFDMPELFVERVRSADGIDHHKVKHVPVIRCYDDEDRASEEF